MGASRKPEKKTKKPLCSLLYSIRRNPVTEGDATGYRSAHLTLHLFACTDRPTFDHRQPISVRMFVPVSFFGSRKCVCASMLGTEIQGQRFPIYSGTARVHLLCFYH